MKAPDWSKPFRNYVDAPQYGVRGTLTQLGDRGNDRAVAYFSKKLSPTEESYTVIDWELFGLFFFLKRFRGYLESSEFEVVADIQVLRHSFSNGLSAVRIRGGSSSNDNSKSPK